MSDLVRFTAHGHSALRATHGKTLEFTAETDVTGRATCVLGVAASLPSTAVAGPIRLTLSLPGQASISLDAIGNSAWQPGESAVVRRSVVRLPDTYATDATLAAADLPRPFAAALADPSAVLSVTVTLLEPVPSLVRFRLYSSSDSRLRAEAEAADLVLAEDAGARTTLSRLGVDVGHGPADGRVLSVSSGPGGSRPAGSADEVIGWPVELAVSAAAADDSPVLLVPARAEIDVLAAAHPESAVVFTVAADRVARTLTTIGRTGADLVLATVADPERPWFCSQSALVLPERGDVACRVAGRPGPAAAAPVDPAAFVRGLLSDGVSARTVALALAGLPGWSRRSAYDFVLAQQGNSA